VSRAGATTHALGRVDVYAFPRVEEIVDTDLSVLVPITKPGC